jgi:NDP-sugar pyrophosphorylase family protein
MKILMPIAGRGSRFQVRANQNIEYRKPKPLIDVKGRPMVRWATGSLPFIKHPGQTVAGELLVEPNDLIFIALQEHDAGYQIGRELKNIYGEDIEIIFLDEVTRGAAETALKAKDFINNDEPLIISDSDHFFDGVALAELLADNPGIDGAIPVFSVPASDTKWSFSRLGDDGYVDQVAEKQPISTWANVGCYYFGKGSDFVATAEEAINNQEKCNNEFYIAPLYNKIIARGGKVKLAFPEYVHGLGTPEDLEFFLGLLEGDGLQLLDN